MVSVWRLIVLFSSLIIATIFKIVFNNTDGALGVQMLPSSVCTCVQQGKGGNSFAYVCLGLFPSVTWI